MAGQHPAPGDEAPDTGSTPVTHPGGFIHHEHPFATPPDQRDPARQFRGRQVSSVSLWTAGNEGRRAGLTVASVTISEPARMLGLVGEDSDLLQMLSAAGVFAVTLLAWRDRRLAEAFSFLAPAPGGPFREGDWQETGWGPVPAHATSWAGCRLTGTRRFGYGVLVEAEIERAAAGELADPLLWHRGRYRRLLPLDG